MKTRFRAFQLDTPGSLFSFYKPGQYTLIEARIPKGGINVLRDDLNSMGFQTISTLHITSWDDDHCNFDDLTRILNNFRPSLIEIPSYAPTTDNGNLCLNILTKYDIIHQKMNWNVARRDYENIKTLPVASYWSDEDVSFHSHYNSPNKNDMSQIKLFRSNGFNVLSLGDCESVSISEELSKYKLIIEEVDVLILPHHGASNSCLTGAFLDAVKPKIAICSSNFDNEYDHPRPDVLQLLNNRNIPSMTTKRGDAIIGYDDVADNCVAYDLKANNTQIHKDLTFKSKRYMNDMTGHTLEILKKKKIGL